MAARQISFGEIISRIRKSLKEGGSLMNIVSDLMIVSQIWVEDNKAYLVAWLPDIDPQKGLTYVRKKIVYDLENNQLVEIRDLQH